MSSHRRIAASLSFIGVATANQISLGLPLIHPLSIFLSLSNPRTHVIIIRLIKIYSYSTPPDSNLPRSPLHIPDSEEEGVAVDLSTAEPPPSPISDSLNQDSEVLGLDGSYGMPS